MWQQVRPFNQSKAGKKSGWCLQNVRLGYGIGSKYPNAISAANNTQLHKNRAVPTGIDVPLYYTFRTDGHINVRLKSGKVWSDGVIYDTIDAYLRSHPEVHYLGWGESINGVQVIKHVADPKPAMPKVGSLIRLLPSGGKRTFFVRGTTKVKGYINPTDNSYVYVVRFVRDNRIGIYSKSGGSKFATDYGEVALRYTNGQLISGWKQL